MRPIATEFADGHFTYRQVAREGMVALYAQTPKTGGAPRYEVVKLRIAPQAVLPDGTEVPEREAYPSSSAWGTLGWTFYSLKAAQTHMHGLLSSTDL